MKRVISIVEDEKDINNLVAQYLRKEGYEVHSYYTYEEASAHVADDDVHLWILDIMLDDKSGFDLIEEIRLQGPETPVIFMSARDKEFDRIIGLEKGCDDYITKPFSVEELLARIRVSQRRLAITQSGKQPETSVFENGGLKIDYTAGCTFLKDRELHLTPIEYKLLCLLSRNVGKVLTHTYITQQIWGRCAENDVASLRVFMATLRKKLELEKNGVQYIQTHIGIGYRMLRIEKPE